MNKSASSPIAFSAALAFWLKLGFISFGGPAGQIAIMHRVLVDERRWIDEQRFLHALNFSVLLPGPEATKLATYAGWLLHGTRGGLAAGILFVLPGALVMLALSMLYALGRGVPAVEGALFGIKAAVLVIVVEALIRIGRRALKTRLAIGIALAAFVAIFFFAVPFPLIVLAAGIIGYIAGRLELQPFLSAGGHGKVGARQVADQVLRSTAPVTSSRFSLWKPLQTFSLSAS
jgi:chromate transporter